MPQELILDFGNMRWKWFNPRTGEYADDRHAIAPLFENEWRVVAGRANPSKGIIKVNGVAYAVGDAALRHVIKDRPKGAARYREDYFGIGLAYALSEGIGQDEGRVHLRASYPPGDVAYIPSLVAAAKQRWTVECRYGTLNFAIEDVGVFDEPIGGYSNFVLTKDGAEKQRNPLADKVTLVVDVGGFTTDVVPVDEGGEIDYSAAKSTRTGVLNMLEKFETEFRHNNKSLFQETGDLDARRVEKALLSGTYRYGRLDIECAREAKAAINTLVNDVREVINASGGAANYDVILLTGGGSALIHTALEQAMPRIEFWLADDNRDNMKFANVFGGAKLFRFVKNMRKG